MSEFALIWKCNLANPFVSYYTGICRMNWGSVFGRWNPPCLWSLDPPRETLRVRRRLRSCLRRSSEHVQRDEFLFAIFEGLAETMRPQTMLARPLVPMSVSSFMRWVQYVLRLFSIFDIKWLQYKWRKQKSSIWLSVHKRVIHRGKRKQALFAFGPTCG